MTRLTAVRSLVLVSIFLSASFAANAQCVIATRADSVQVRFVVELADTPASRQRGLMYRQSLPPRTGMWFDFGRDTGVRMWMKNTPLGLDMLFVTGAGELVALEQAEPFSEQRLGAGRDVRYVLEIAAGEAERYALTIGDRLQLFANC